VLYAFQSLLYDGGRPLYAGDVCRPEARIVLVVNSNDGKIVKVKGYVYCHSQPVIKAVSSFLYCGRFTDYENTFEITEEPDYLVPLDTDAAVGVLQSKDKGSISVTNDIFVRNQLKIICRLPPRQFSGQPYLQQHGTPQESRSEHSSLEGGIHRNGSGYEYVIQSAFTNEPYSKISSDFNPIQVNSYFSDFAATITHRIWTSAATCCFLESVVGKGYPERVIA
jgi:fatty acid synthase subunit beta